MRTGVCRAVSNNKVPFWCLRTPIVDSLQNRTLSLCGKYCNNKVCALFAEIKRTWDLYEKVYNHIGFNPLAKSNTPVCGWRYEPADNTSIHVVLGCAPLRLFCHLDEIEAK